jgi:hypothetical protein
MAEQATEMCERIRNCGSYYSALGVIGEYVNITSVGDEDESENDACEYEDRELTL